MLFLFFLIFKLEMILLGNNLYLSHIVLSLLLVMLVFFIVTFYLLCILSTVVNISKVLIVNNRLISQC